jgi:hypothetical protein
MGGEADPHGSPDFATKIGSIFSDPEEPILVFAPVTFTSGVTAGTTPL